MRLGLGYEGTSVVRCGWAKISSRLVTATRGSKGPGGGLRSAARKAVFHISYLTIIFQTLHILRYEGAERRPPLLHIL